MYGSEKVKKPLALTVSQGWRDQDLLKAGRNVAIVIVSH